MRNKFFTEEDRKIDQNESEQQFSEADERENDFSLEAEQQIGKCLRFWYRFRIPDVYQIITIAFLITYWLNLTLKLIFSGIYDSISPSDTNFIDLSSAESFQYAIFFFDY